MSIEAQSSADRIAELEAELHLIRRGVQRVWDVTQVAIERHAIDARSAIADAVLDLKDAAITPPSEGSAKNFTLSLDDERAGIVFDALMLHRSDAIRRKGANPESMGDFRADVCGELMLRIGRHFQGAGFGLPPEPTEGAARRDGDA